MQKSSKVFRNSEDGLRLFVEGMRRAELVDVMQDTPFLLGEIALTDEVESAQTHRSQALVRHAKQCLSNIFKTIKVYLRTSL